MIPEQLEEQAALYVLGALETEEMRAFEEQLAGNDELREHVRALSDVAGNLAHAAPARPLPPHLEARIMADIRGGTSVAKVTPLRVQWLPWAVAASLAVACVVAFSQRQRLANELTAARSEAAAARDNITSTQGDIAAARAEAASAKAQVATLAADKDRAEKQIAELRQREADARTQMVTLAEARDEARQKIAQLESRREEPQQRQAAEDRTAADELSNVQVATLTSKMRRAPNATAAIAWDSARQRGVLNSANIPPNAVDRDYQLWIIDSRFADPVDAGVFHVEKSGSARYVFTPKVRIDSALAFAVSLERRGGVPKAEGPIVLAGK